MKAFATPFRGKERTVIREILKKNELSKSFHIDSKEGRLPVMGCFIASAVRTKSRRFCCVPVKFEVLSFELYSRELRIEHRSFGRGSAWRKKLREYLSAFRKQSVEAAHLDP